ncbi:hypothetical protein JZ751_016734 [Albula glossodonta]|uniref:Uncharacterized protein n=1 Tax=Albula glossodonta TaxID=121402 RepID=A0A8T2NXG7_9TELE|nr:hypothetical protein JZ751_016734 [Albula glossodonta]
MPLAPCQCITGDRCNWMEPKDKEQRRLQQQLSQQMQQLNSASTWGSLSGLASLTPQYLAVRGPAANASTTAAALLQQATSTSNLGAFNSIQQMAGLSALQLQNLAALAAAATQSSASPTNPLSSSPAGTTPSSNTGASMNSLTSLGTLQGLAGATVGLNNINALAGSVNSKYSFTHPSTSPPASSAPSCPHFAQVQAPPRQTGHAIRICPKQTEKHCMESENVHMESWRLFETHSDHLGFEMVGL